MKLSARVVGLTQSTIELKEAGPEGLVAYCMAGHHKVLTKNLDWVETNDLKVGDVILGFDEEGPHRKYKSATVLSHRIERRDAVSVKLESGKEFIVTPDHKMLMAKLKSNKKNHWLYEWKEAGALKVGDATPLLVGVWDSPPADQVYRLGYLSGIYDGEGWLTKNGRKVGFAQRPGIVLEKTLSYLAHLGFNYTQYQRADGCVNIGIAGYACDRVKFLSWVRPQRLLEKFTFEMLGNLQPKDNFDKVISVTPVGQQLVVVMETSTGTLILDGYPHHNCARVSNPQHQDKEIGSLFNYCIRNKHWSIFEMANAVVEVEAPRDITRQLLRHRSFSFQEFSQRYSDEIEFTEREFRRQDTKNRQNSVDDLDPDLQNEILREVDSVAYNTKDLYKVLRDVGVAKECARVILPEGLTMSRLYANGTIRSWLHYLDVRDDPGVTQWEHVLLARKIREVLEPVFPSIFRGLNANIT